MKKNRLHGFVRSGTQRLDRVLVKEERGSNLAFVV